VSLIPISSRFAYNSLCRWEFFSSLWFEWQIITRKRGHHWSIWVSLLTNRLHQVVIYCSFFDSYILAVGSQPSSPSLHFLSVSMSQPQ
jgi:hypothetical protein